MNIIKRIRFELFHVDAKAWWGTPLTLVIMFILAFAVIMGISQVFHWLGF